jgi:hypothetical protein
VDESAAYVPDPCPAFVDLHHVSRRAGGVVTPSILDDQRRIDTRDSPLNVDADKSHTT